MVKLTRIYTRGGDKGDTSLGDGSRVAKHDPRVEAYGTVDEANAAVGLARLHAEGEAEAMLARIQNDLFDLGADLCRPEEEESDRKGPEKKANAKKAASLRIVEAQVARLEREIDALNAELAPLTSFVLPGGTAGAAHLHLARTICRRAERIMVELAAKPDEPVGDAAIQYMNRLSDFLFVASRSANSNGAGDVLWVPGQNR